jgi:hypothetical protein
MNFSALISGEDFIEKFIEIFTGNERIGNADSGEDSLEMRGLETPIVVKIHWK